MKPTKTVFLLGAGLSHAVSKSMPLTKDLGKQIVKRYTGEFSARQKADLIEDSTEKFEKLLTWLALRKPWLSEADNLRERAVFLDLTNCVRVLFEEAVFNAVTDSLGEAPEWWLRLLSYWHYQHSPVITLNYDTLIEWTSSRFYTSSKENVVLATNQLYPIALTPAHAASGHSSESQSIESFQLYKLHGSINWFYSGQENFYGEPIFFTGCNDGLLGIWSEAQKQKEKIERRMLSGKVPLIIPPVLDKTFFFKHEIMQSLWFKAGNALRKADKIVCIGYSLPKSDLTMAEFIKDACAGRKIPFEIIDLRDGMIPHFKSVLGDESFDFYQNFSGNEAVANFSCQLT